jgi:hypothetical protein
MKQAIDLGPFSTLRALEGHRVGLALADGSRFDDVMLVSCGRRGTTSVWLDVDGMDLFVERSQVLDAWEHRVRGAA